MSRKKEFFDQAIKVLKPNKRFPNHIGYVWHYAKESLKEIFNTVDYYEIPSRHTKTGNPFLVSLTPEEENEND